MIIGVEIDGYFYQNEFHYFCTVLKKSAENHNKDYSPTMEHIANIAALAYRKFNGHKNQQESEMAKRMEEAESEWFDDMHKYGSDDD